MLRLSVKEMRRLRSQIGVALINSVDDVCDLDEISLGEVEDGESKDEK